MPKGRRNCTVRMTINRHLWLLALACTVVQAALAANLSWTDDFVFAVGTSLDRLPLVHVGAAWREGIRSMILLDDKDWVGSLDASEAHASETYGYFPDNDLWTRFAKRGDRRMNVALIDAHQKYGQSYKWMLAGDDDTVFFRHNLEAMLADYDHNLPYVITDNVWWMNSVGSTVYDERRNQSITYHPHWGYPRCLPCHFRREDAAGPKIPGRPELPVGCPCTVERACSLDPAACKHPKFRVPSPHGGSGMVISRGLFEALDLERLEHCFKRSIGEYTGSDHLLAVCLWQQHVALTDPGHFWAEKYNLFDDPHLSYHKVWWSLENLLQCNTKRCREGLHLPVSFHLYARLLKSEAAAEALMQVSLTMEEVSSMLKKQRHPLRGRGPVKIKTAGRLNKLTVN